MKLTSRHKARRLPFRPRLESLETRLTPTTYSVSSLADSGDGSLRAAITSVNADPAGSVDEIDFSVAGVIQLTSAALPAISNTVKIDGSTAPGFAGSPVVEIDNNGFAGLMLGGSNSSLISLSIVDASSAGVTLNGQYSSGIGGPITGQNITIVGNYIGLALDGSIAANTGYGLQTNNSNCTIGGTTAADRNVISGNGAGGIQINNGGSGFHITLPNGALVEGNFIGTDPTGQSAAPNQGNGITITNAGSTIGGTDPGAGNVIAFNTQAGVMMSPGSGVIKNSIFRNGSTGIDVEGPIFSGGGGDGQILPTPQLSYAVESPGSGSGSAEVRVGGVLVVPNIFPFFDAAGLACTIQVYASLDGVPPGQGQIFLGSVQLTTNSGGFAKFSLNASVPADKGATFTATVSTPYFSTSNTSEFSAPIAIGGNANNLFVASAYGLLFNRYPDSGAAYWINRLNNGDSAPGIVLGIEGSTEYLNEQVTAMYKLYLQRAPDTVGQQAWTNFLLAGGTFEAVAAQLTASQEYFVLQGGTNQGFITHLYYDVLHRYAPSNAEIAGWEIVLDNGVSRLQASVAFLTSREYRANLVQADYLTFLLRSVDDGGLAAWVNALNAGATDQQVLAQIFGSPEGYQLWS
jgi:hypothetical protein